LIIKEVIILVKVGYCTTQEVADKLKISKKTLYRWEAAGKIPKARRHPMNQYRAYTKQDVEKIRKLIKEKTMYPIKQVHCIEANKVTPDLWRTIKSEFPRKYALLQKDIKAWGANKVKIYFAEGLRPVQIGVVL